MVLRRLAVVVMMLVCALAGAVPATAQQPVYGDETEATYDDGTSYDENPYDDGSYDDGDYGDAGVEDGTVMPGDMPATLPTVTPTTPAPATTGPTAPTAPGSTLPPVAITRTIAGRAARMRTDGKAAIPRGAPKAVQTIIAAANRIVGKPYKWGGGHAKLVDRGYDCSGAVSYALIRARLLASPLVSGSLARYSSAGAGRWVSVYANKGHVYMEVAGLRLDTSPVGDATRRTGVRWRPAIGRRAGFSARHPAGL